MELVDHGFGQRDSDLLAYGFIVSNPQNVAVAEANYEVRAWDESGVLVMSENRGIPPLAASQRIGLAGIMLLPIKTKIDRLDISVRGGTRSSAEVFQFSTEVGKFSSFFNTSSGKLTGIITNRGAKPITYVMVYGVAYDSSGAIVGGGYDVLNVALPGVKTAVGVTMSGSGMGTRFELYASPSSISAVQQQ